MFWISILRWESSLRVTIDRYPSSTRRPVPLLLLATEVVLRQLLLLWEFLLLLLSLVCWQIRIGL